MLSDLELERRFGSKDPKDFGKPSKAPIHRDFRELFKEFAAEVDARLPEGRYKDLALLDLETAAMWSHKSIAMDLDFEAHRTEEDVECH